MVAAAVVGVVVMVAATKSKQQTHLCVAEVSHDGVQGSNLPDLLLFDVHVVPGGEVVVVGTADPQVVEGDVVVSSVVLQFHAVGDRRVRVDRMVVVMMVLMIMVGVVVMVMMMMMMIMVVVVVVVVVMMMVLMIMIVVGVMVVTVVVVVVIMVVVGWW